MYPMRRSDREQGEEFALSLIDHCSHGVMSIHTSEAFPYCLPLSFVRNGNCLYFHCAKAGHKLDAVARCDKASFCVIDQDRVVPEEYTTYFRSVIAFGRIRVIGDDGERRSAVERLALKYHPGDTPEHRNRYIDSEWAPLCMLEMTIDHMTGKEAIELVKAKEAK